MTVSFKVIQGNETYIYLEHTSLLQHIFFLNALTYYYTSGIPWLGLFFPFQLIIIGTNIVIFSTASTSWKNTFDPKSAFHFVLIC